MKQHKKIFTIYIKPMDAINQEEINRLLRMRDNIRKAQKKYRESHPDVMNQYASDYYHRHKDEPDFVQKRRDRSLEYYARKKAQRASQSVA